MEKDRKDYSKTVNLPQTGFPMKASLPQREPQYLTAWEEQSVYAKVQAKNNGKKKFILHDGPPYANGHIHLGTSLNKILKDFIVKYKSMSGHDAPYTPGWDCHGLPIEQQAMKEMKVDKHKVSRVEFRRQAAAFARKFIDIQRQEFKRLGVLGDWEKPYLTLDPKYESTIVKVFGQLAEKGYIYRSKKPVYWCPTCETALADAEVEYADHISHSVYVKFAVVRYPEAMKGEPGASVLIWTTTPWTLPANVALAFQPRAEYVSAVLELPNGRTENLILAKRLLPSVAEKLSARTFTVKKEFPGTALEGIVCRNPLVDRESKGILADYVSLDDGTGVVHIAPGHGQEDYQAGLKYDLPIISPVDDRGIFTDEVPEFAGHKVLAANPLIVEKLTAVGSLLHEEKLTHSYPHCWRCKRPIIFRATPQWFMSVEHDGLRAAMLDTVKKVQWIPSYGENRIAGMVDVRPDWCLSRQRLWGVPIPVFYCSSCGEPLLDGKVIGHIAGLFAEHGSDYWFERTPAELLAPLSVACKKCGGAEFRKEEDILDVWFDSGVSSEAVLASGNFPALRWPADMYLEGSDQHRGWFQTSLIPAVALHGGAPYKTVLTHGFVVDGEGKKMSKSIGNTIAPQQIIDQYGADILRLWAATSDYREDIRVSTEILKGLTDAYRKIRNTLRFLLGNTFDFAPGRDTVSHKDLREIDRYALDRLCELTGQVTTAYDSYEFHKAAVAINTFCTVFLSGFYLDAQKDTLYCAAPGSAERRSAQTALWHVCSALTRMLAPILSFTAEECWQELRRMDPSLAASVFLADFPAAEENHRLAEVALEKWRKLLAIRETALQEFEKLRRDKKIGSNLEASVEILYDAEDAVAVEDRGLLSMALGTWDVTVAKNADPGSMRAGTKVTARGASDHGKCARCWRHTEDTDAATCLCARCRDVIA